MLSIVTSHLIPVQCELGRVDGAMHLAKTELDDLERRNSLHHGIGRRLRLASADSHLMKALWTVNAALVTLGKISRPLDSLRYFIPPKPHGTH
jgi:hypothetical protein